MCCRNLRERPEGARLRRRNPRGVFEPRELSEHCSVRGRISGSGSALDDGEPGVWKGGRKQRCEGYGCGLQRGRPVRRGLACVCYSARGDDPLADGVHERCANGRAVFHDPTIEHGLRCLRDGREFCQSALQ